MNIQPEWFQWGPAVAILVLILGAVGGFLFWYFKRVATREDDAAAREEARQEFLEKMIEDARLRDEEHIKAWRRMTEESISAQQAGIAAMKEIGRAIETHCEQAERIGQVTVQHLLELKQVANKG